MAPRALVPRTDVTAWRPPVPGVREVFHARFTEHVYPPHTHDVWTLLIVDAGAVRYDLDRHTHGAVRSVVTLLPPDVAHDGRSARPGGFRKRVLYLERTVFGDGADALIGAAVDRPDTADDSLRRHIHHLHTTLALRGERFAAESHLALIAERLRERLRGRQAPPRPRRERRLAHLLRDLLESRTRDGMTLDEASRLLGAHRAHLIRVFTREFGIPPHRYLTARRIDLARRYLLAGHTCAETAVLSGFYDQAHLTRHFTRLLGVSPARYAARR